MKWMRFKLFGCLLLATLMVACNKPSGSKNSNSYKNVYDAYCEKHPEYKGDIYQWLDDLANGRLASDIHTVTFECFGYCTVPEQKVLHGGKIEKPKISLSSDFEFRHWVYVDLDSIEGSELEIEEGVINDWIAEDYGIPWYFNLYTVQSDITLYATVRRKGSSESSNWITSYQPSYSGMSEMYY